MSPNNEIKVNTTNLLPQLDILETEIVFSIK